MALLPNLAFTSLGEGPQTVEFWLDYTCPYSAKSCVSLETFLIPKIVQGGPWYGQVRFLIRPYIQPWHPIGGWITGAAMAFGHAFSTSGTEEDGPLWFKAFAELFRRQKDFKGEEMWDTSIEGIQKLACEIAGGVYAREKGGTVEDAAAKVHAAIYPPPRTRTMPETADIKYFTRLGRQNGIHWTLSVVVNGIYDPAPQSNWQEEEWVAWFAKQGISADRS